MKKLWGNTLTTIGNTVTAAAAAAAANAAAAAAPKQPGGSDSRSSTPAPNTPTGFGQEKQYLRLPLDSARKLRWFDKGDLPNIVKTHAREKRELLDAITALKKLLIQAGYSDHAIDVETRHLLAQASEQEEADEGVYSTLLVALQAEYEALQGERHRQEQQLEEMKQRLEELESKRPSHFCLSEEGTSGDGSTFRADPAAGSSSSARQGAAIDPDLAARLQRVLDTFEQCSSSAATLAQQVRSHEQLVAAAEAEDAIRMLTAQQASLASASSGRYSMDATDAELASALSADPSAAGEGVFSEQSTPTAEARSLRRDLQSEREQRLTMVAKLQRLELEKRTHVEEISELSVLLTAARRDTEAARAALAEQEQQARQVQGAVESLQVELVAARSQLRAAEEERQKRPAAVPGNMEMLSRYRDIAAENEERAIAAERRLGLAEARLTKAEGSYKDAVADFRAAQKSLAALQQANEQLSLKLREAEGSAEAARQQQETARSSEALLKMSEQLRQLEADNDRLQRELAGARSAAAGLESRLQSAEVREARHLAEAREAEALAAEHEELMAQVAALRDHLEESRAERGQLDHYRSISRELEGAKARVEEELLATAQLVTKLEARLRESHTKAQLHQTNAEHAEMRVRHAEADVAAEVERRMAAAAANRAMWPQPVKEEISRLEAKVEAVQGMLAVVQNELDRESQLHQQESQLKTELQRRLIDLEEAVVRQQREGAQAQQELAHQLQKAVQEGEEAREAVARLQQEHEEIVRAGPFSRRMSRVHSRDSGLGSPLRTSSGNIDTPKWQVQNKVGSGALYNLQEGMAAAAAAAEQQQHHQQHSPTASAYRNSSAGGAPPAASRDKVQGVDLQYLRNVLLKFLEAYAAGRVTERDALLPAIATLVQASPAEFHVMKRVLANTAPPATQVLSALGIKF